MIVKNKPLVPITAPANLTPYMFHCKDCGSTIRRIEETNSFVLVNITKDVQEGKKKICSFCFKLNEYLGGVSCK